jgi:type I restriction enzyme S subunit
MRIAVDLSLLSRFVSQTSISHLTREKFALLPVPLPPFDEQQQIVAALDAHDMRIHAEGEYRDKLREMKQGLMDDLLSGKIRAVADGTGR